MKTINTTPPVIIAGRQLLSSNRSTRAMIGAIGALVIATAGNSFAAHPSGFGRVLGSNPVTVYSNAKSGYFSGVRNPVTVRISGRNVTFPGGWSYQCVELIQRLCITLHKLDPQAAEYGGGADAVGWWNKTKFFNRYTNGGTTKPAVGDIIVWKNGSGPGHIAVVTAVNTSSVTIAEQNILCNTEVKSGSVVTRSDAKHVVTMTKATTSSGTTYKIDNNAPNSRGGYTTVGWLRKK